MEFILAKFYLIIVFTILLSIATLLITQLKLKQNLEQSLSDIQLKTKTDQNSNEYETKFKLGQIFLRKKLYNKAIQEFRDCVTSWDKNDRLGLASLLNSIGFTYYQLKNYDIAAYYYTIALTLAPDHLTSLTNIAYLYQNQNKRQDLVKAYERLLHLAPDNKRTKEIGEYLSKRL